MKAIQTFISQALIVIWALVPLAIAVDIFIFIFIDLTLLDWTAKRICMAIIWCSIGGILICERCKWNPVLIDEPQPTEGHS